MPATPYLDAVPANLVDKEEASESSTITVEGSKDREDLISLVTTATPPTRKVHFDETSNVFHKSHWTKREYESMWHKPEDYKTFKTNSLYQAREIARAEESNRAPHSYSRVLLRTFEACMSISHEFYGKSVLSEHEQRHLHRWAEVATSHLGLERWACRPIGKDKHRRRRDIADVVLDIQELYMIGTMDEKAERMRQVSMNVSRPSRLFARELAEAQATILMKDEQSEKFFSSCR